MTSVLLVDGDEIVRTMIANGLSRLGHAVHAVDRAEALNGALLKEVRPSLVITELNLPGTPGDQLCRALSKVKASLPMKVIVVSDDDEKDLVRRARAARADGFGSKDMLLTNPEGFLFALAGHAPGAPSRPAAAPAAPPPSPSPAPSKPPPAPPRAAPPTGRLACQFPVMGHDSQSAPFHGMVQVLHAGGADVLTNISPPVGHVLSLGFSTPKGQIQCQGKVTAVGPGGGKGLVCVAFEFTGLGASARERLDGLLGS